jgi:hypothetical protein
MWYNIKRNSTTKGRIFVTKAWKIEIEGDDIIKKQMFFIKWIY